MTLSCSPRLSRQEAGEGQPSPHLPRSRDCRFSRSASLPVCHPERSSHFFASGVEGSTRSDFFFPARFQTNRFAAIPPRVRFGLRLAHLVGMTNKGARENRQSLSGGERAPLRRPREGPFSARLLRRATMISDGKVHVIAAAGFVSSPLTRSASSGKISEPSASRDSNFVGSTG